MSTYEFFRVRDLERDALNQKRREIRLENMLKYLCKECVENGQSDIIKNNKELKRWWKNSQTHAL